MGRLYISGEETYLFAEDGTILALADAIEARAADWDSITLAFTEPDENGVPQWEVIIFRGRPPLDELCVEVDDTNAALNPETLYTAEQSAYRHDGWIVLDPNNRVHPPGPDLEELKKRIRSELG